MQKVSLYVRHHSTRKLEKAKSRTAYPMGTIFVLRFGGRWETLKDNLTFTEATVAAKQKEIALVTGAARDTRAQARAEN